MLTIVIPAYNEANSINKTLIELVGFSRETLEVIVIPNGCTDKTVDIVKQGYPQFRIVELTKGSKINAINEGIRLAKNKNILIQDADVVIGKKSIESMLHFIEKEKYLFASPVPKLKISGSLAVSMYYRFLKLTPAYNSGMVNSGAYLLSSLAVKRLGVLPNVIADDGYVKGILDSKHLKNIPGCFSEVDTPKNLWSLIKIKTRSKLGNVQLKSKFKSPVTGDNNLKSLINIAITQKAFFAFIVYFSVTLVSLIRAKYQLKNIESMVWERDESSRI